MLKKINYFNCQGKEMRQCKDTIYIRDNGEYGYYSLADGLNSRKKSHIGARQVQKAIADVWENQQYFFDTPIIEIKSTIIEIIHEVLYNLSKEESSVDEYASTLLILFISQKDGRYKWVHIGDGLIVKENFSGEMEIVSHSQNGITSQFTFTTTSRRLERYLRMGEGNLSDIQRFMLFTDGAILPFYKERKLTETGEDFLKRGTEVFGRILEQLDIQDDYSMLDVRI